MPKVLKALLVTAAATGALALLLNYLDLDGGDDVGTEPGFLGMDPDNMSEEDVDTLMRELASQLGG